MIAKVTVTTLRVAINTEKTDDMTKPPSQDDRLDGKHAWAKQHGLVESHKSRYTGLRFLNHKMPASYDYTRFPAQDHTHYWNKDGKPYCVTSQPYHVHDDEMAEAAKLCNLYDLRCCITSYPAWHYPGSVVFMEWRRKELTKDG